MRIYFTIIIFLVCISHPLLAQNISVAVQDTIAEGEPGSEIVLEGLIKNVSDTTIRVTITRETNVLPDNWTSSLCLDVCALPWTDFLSKDILAGDSAHFSIHFFTDTQPGTGEARLSIVEQNSGESYSYLFQAISSASTSIAYQQATPHSCVVVGNYPNPFNSSTFILFEIFESVQFLTFKVFNPLEELVFQQKIDNVSVGKNVFSFSGRNHSGRTLPSGNYFYSLSFINTDGSEFTQVKKFTLIK